MAQVSTDEVVIRLDRREANGLATLLSELSHAGRNLESLNLWSLFQQLQTHGVTLDSKRHGW